LQARLREQITTTGSGFFVICGKTFCAAGEKCFILNMREVTKTLRRFVMYKHILIPLDGSVLAEQVLPHVQALVRPEDDVRITLLRAVPPVHASTVEFGGMYAGSVAPAENLEPAEQTARDYLVPIANRLQADGYHVALHISRLMAAEAILDYAEHHQVDLIAIATHGRSGVSRWVFGSVTQKVIHAATVPVLVIRPQEKGSA
jgi:nucleotide-binding universal stress UspA family protein